MTHLPLQGLAHVIGNLVLLIWILGAIYFAVTYAISTMRSDAREYRKQRRHVVADWDQRRAREQQIAELDSALGYPQRSNGRRAA